MDWIVYNKLRQSPMNSWIIGLIRLLLELNLVHRAGELYFDYQLAVVGGGTSFCPQIMDKLWFLFQMYSYCTRSTRYRRLLAVCSVGETRKKASVLPSYLQNAFVIRATIHDAVNEPISIDTTLRHLPRIWSTCDSYEFQHDHGRRMLNHA